MSVGGSITSVIYNSSLPRNNLSKAKDPREKHPGADHRGTKEGAHDLNTCSTQQYPAVLKLSEDVKPRE